MKRSILRASLGSSFLLAVSSWVLVIGCDSDSFDDSSNDDASAGEATSGGTAAGGNSAHGGTKAQAGTSSNGGAPYPADNEAGATANGANGGSYTEGGASSEDGGAGAEAGAGGAPACVPEPPVLPINVPAGIVVAETATLLRSLHAVGTQNYRCTQTAGAADADPTFTWVLVAPVADLFNSCGVKVGSHFAVPGSVPPAPEWKYDVDGSTVTGVRVNSAPVVGSIPELLLMATDHGGDGVFAGVTFVQRLHTVGGAAPALADCTIAHVNDVAEVGYSAQYYFYSGGT
jgi:hypothetical protein